MIVKTQKEYPILFQNSFQMLPQALREQGIINTRLCVVTDSHVAALYQDEIMSLLPKPACIFVFEAGEASKNLTTIQALYDFFIAHHLDRKSVVIALGGGVCGDMAGFAAATYMRGIRFVQVPTTLLAQVDSSVGGKVGVDYAGKKNMIGAFYQPELVYINPQVLKTLPKREFYAGMAEVIKHGVILDAQFLQYLQEQADAVNHLEVNSLIHVIQRCCELKAQIVSQDEKESGIRELLNFGHTFGHAVESCFHFQMLHGECVAIGMVAVARLSMQMGGFIQEEYDQLIRLLRLYCLPTALKVEAEDRENTTGDLLTQMAYDKKAKNGAISFVLLKALGQAYLQQINLSEEQNEKYIRAVISHIVNPI